MGAVCGAGRSLANGVKAYDENLSDGIVDPNTVHMLILALDYPGTGNELTCTQDGNNMEALARNCGVQDITKLTDNECHKQAVVSAIQQVASRCGSGDYFVFNYSGHGTSVQDRDGDEDDGMDEALCLVTPQGTIDFDAFMTDDEFAELITSCVPEDVEILILCDCCHSGTIGDFNNRSWGNHRAVSLSGCLDAQTSGDTGRGGIFTHSLLKAVEQKQLEGEDAYSIAQLYNEQLDQDDTLFGSEQEITMKWTAALAGPTDMAWPFVPTYQYRAPWSQ